MNIRAKLIIACIIITLVSSLPLSFFIFSYQKNQEINRLITEGKLNSTVMAQSVVNVLMMNGGDVLASSVDANDMISMFKPLSDRGFRYAEAVMLSSNPRINGRILAQLTPDAPPGDIPARDGFIDGDELLRMKNSTGFSEMTPHNSNKTYYEFIAAGAPQGEKPVCLARMLYSKSAVLKPLVLLENFILVATFTAIALAIVVGLFLSRQISWPVRKLIDGVAQFEKGELDYRINIDSEDELGRLGSSFNEMADALNRHIDDLESANRELERTDRLKDEFLANTSHELKTPLNGIIGLAESLLAGAAGETTPGMAENLRLIVHSGSRLENMVNEILDFSRLKHNEISLECRHIDAHVIAGVVLSVLTPLAGKKGIELVNEVPRGCAICADEARVQQIFYNIVGNAIKFTEKGKVMVAAGSSAGDDREIAFSVIDTGEGIADDHLSDVFEPFVQGDGSITRRYGGAGLGLAITRRLVELHDGKITIQSNENGGTTVTFTLPAGSIEKTVDTVEITPRYGKELQQGASGSDMNILKVRDMSGGEEVSDAEICVVDDDPVNLQVVTNQLQIAGYRVTVFRDAADFLGKMELGYEPDLLLLDVMMPGISGYDVCRKIREKYSHYQMPIILLTAKNAPSDLLIGFQLGANDYISKPFDRQELLARLENLIALKKAAAAHSRFMLLQHDLTIAMRIQQSILPESLPDMEGIRCAVRYVPMEIIGGDYYDFHIAQPGKLSAFIADVSGHGVPAAIISAMVKIAFAENREYVAEPHELMEMMNTTLSRYSYEQYVTAGCVYLDIDAMQIHVANAGHWPLLIWRGCEKKIISVEAKGRVIGYFPQQEFTKTVLSVLPGDRIIMYTDGILECRNEDDEMFSEDRMFRFIEEGHDLSPDEFADSMIISLQKWSGMEDSFDDDVTLVVVDVE